MNTTYLVVWSGGTQPLSVDSFGDETEAKAAYRFLDDMFNKSPTDFVTLLAVRDGKATVADGTGYDGTKNHIYPYTPKGPR